MKRADRRTTRPAGGFDRNARFPRGLRVSIWEPGRRIEISKRLRTARIVSGVILLVVASGALALRLIPELATPFADSGLALLREVAGVARADELAPWIQDGMIPFAAACALAGLWLLRSAMYLCQFDLLAGRVRVRLGLTSQHLGLSDIEAVVVKEVLNQNRWNSTSHTGGSARYGFRLELWLRSGEAQPLMRERNCDFDDMRDFDALYPLAKALAGALGVPHGLDDLASRGIEIKGVPRPAGRAGSAPAKHDSREPDA